MIEHCEMNMLIIVLQRLNTQALNVHSFHQLKEWFRRTVSLNPSYGLLHKGMLLIKHT